MVKAALTRLLGSPQEAAKAADSNDEGDSESDGTAHSDDEVAGPLALRVGGTMMFYIHEQGEIRPDPLAQRGDVGWPVLLRRQVLQHPGRLPERDA